MTLWNLDKAISSRNRLQRAGKWTARVDDPKSLEELQADVGKPGSGYEVHHIVEQAAAAREGHSREDIDAPDNLVRVPT